MKATAIPLDEGLEAQLPPQTRKRDYLLITSFLIFGGVLGYAGSEYVHSPKSLRGPGNVNGGGVESDASEQEVVLYDTLDGDAPEDADDDAPEDADDDYAVALPAEDTPLPKVHAKAKDVKDEALKFEQPLPPLSELVEDHEVKSDVSWMLDFAVIGNAKSGTTFLKNYLGKFDEIYMDPNEICKMSNNRTDQVVEFFYDRLVDVDAKGRYDYTPDGRRIKTGLKCPKEVGTRDALGNYATHFPNTNFIVTVRHPVLWFQSFYNYRSYGAYPGRLPPTHDLVGSCVEDDPYTCPHGCGQIRTQNVCTNRANFHHQLSRFGKTPMKKEESELLKHDMNIVPVKTKIFLAELDQFMPDNEASERMAEDLSNFLGLEKQLPSLQEFGGHKRSYPDEEKRNYFIDICDDEHRKVREILVDIGKEAAEWIGKYFVESPDVVVSSKELFLKLIEEWGHDPCITDE